MSLTDGAVAALADQAAALVPGAVEVHIQPASENDPYRWGAAYWTVRLRAGADDVASVRLTESDSPAEALARLVQALSDAGRLPSRGDAGPAGPDDRPSAPVRVEGDEVVVRDPDTAEVVVRIRPELPQ